MARPRCLFLAALLLPAAVFCQAPGPKGGRPTTRAVEHYLLVASGPGTNPTFPKAPALSLLDRNSATVLWELTLPTQPGATFASRDGGTIYVLLDAGIGIVDVPGGTMTGLIPLSTPPGAAVQSPNGTTLYLAMNGTAPGVAVVDLQGGAVTALIPLAEPATSLVWATGAGGVARVLAVAGDTVVAIDPASNTMARSLVCPAAVDRLVYDSYNLRTYGGMSGQAVLCVITPAFELGPPVPLGVTWKQDYSSALVLNNGGEGILLMTNWDGAKYVSTVLDLHTSTSYPAPILDGVTPGAVTTDRRGFFGESGDSRSGGAFERYQLGLRPDGGPQFSLQVTAPAAVPHIVAADDRFVYSLAWGYCSTIEGPVGCGVGFNLLDPLTLLPRPQNSLVTSATQESWGLFSAQTTWLSLSWSYPAPPGQR